MLKRVEIAGGAPQTLCEARGRVTGGTWNRDGVIVFNFGLPEALYQIPASGGTPRPVTSLTSLQHIAHINPWFLPDGRRFLFTALSKDPERQGIHVGSLDSSDLRRVLSVGTNSAYAPPGFLVFVQEKKIMAQPFDAVQSQLVGQAAVVASGVWTMGGLGIAQANFSVSDEGTLVFGDAGALSGQLMWIDRSGRRLGRVGAPGPFIHFDLSPDEKRVLLERWDPDLGKGGLWVLDLSRGDALSPLTTSEHGSYLGFWSGDGGRIVYARSGLGSPGDVTTADASGAGGAVAVARNGAPSDWSRDGRYIIYGPSPTAERIWALPVDNPSQPFEVLKTGSTATLGVHGGRLSPDGRWMAYVSNESGSVEVFVCPFPSGQGKWPTSIDSGSQPRWRADGKELYYVAKNGDLMAVSVTTTPRFEAGTPTPLFALRGVEFSNRSDYAPGRDGQRFLVNVLESKMDSNSLTVIDGWQAGLVR